MHTGGIYHVEDPLRRALATNSRIEDYDIIYAVLPDGKYIFPGGVDLYDATAEDWAKMSLMPNEAACTLDTARAAGSTILQVFPEWNTEEEVVERMSNLLGKFWLNPSNGVVYSILHYDKPCNAKHVGRLNVLAEGRTSITQFSANGHYFDLVWNTPPELFFESPKKVRRAIANTWKLHYQLSDNNKNVYPPR